MKLTECNLKIVDLVAIFSKGNFLLSPQTFTQKVIKLGHTVLTKINRFQDCLSGGHILNGDAAIFERNLTFDTPKIHTQSN